MAISDSQKVDYLWKKIGYSATKSDNVKAGFEEAIPSPLQIRGDKVMTDSGSIPGTIPGANTSILTVYTTSLPYECAVDGTTATPNRTWKTTLTDWISPEFGSTYQVKVWVNLASSAGNASTAGTSLSAGGSGNNDEWFFDYQAGTLHFIGTNLPNGVSFTGKSVYISGARYTGGFGVSAPGSSGSVGNLTISNVTISANSSAISSSANIIFSTSGTGAVQFTGNNAIGLPVGNIANRPTRVNAGYLRFNTEYETIEVWDGTEWVQTSGGVITSDVLNGDGSTTQFALSANTTTTGVLVSINGTIQKPSTAYTVSNNTITFTEIPALGDAIEVRKLSGGTISVNYGNADVAAFLSTYSGLYSNVQTLTYLTSGVAGNIIPSANVTYSLGSPTRQWKDLFVSNTTIYLGGIPLSIDASGNLLVNGSLVQGSGGSGSGTSYSNVNVAAYLSTNNYLTSTTANLSNYAYAANITTANLSMKGYVDNSVSTANIGIIGYIDRANTIQSNQISAANLGIIGYVDNSTSTANIGMKGYVDSVATLSSYSNVNVSALITTNGLTNYSNVNTAAYLATASINTTGNITAGTISASNIVLNGSTVSIGAINPAYMVVGLVASITGFGASSTFVLDTVVGNVNSQTSYNASTGVFTLTAGVTYDLSFTPSFITFSNTTGGYLCYQWVDATANTPLDSTGIGIGTSIPTTESGGQNDNPTARVIYTPSTNQTVKLYVTSGNGTATLRGAIGTQAVVRPLNSTFALQSNITFANIVSTGNITATNFIGNGALLTNLPTGSNYSNVEVAAYLPTYSGNVANIRLGNSGVLTFADGTTQTTAGGSGSNYSNSNVSAYLISSNATFIGNTGNVSSVYPLQSNITQVFIGPQIALASGNANVTNTSWLLNNLYFNGIGNLVVRNTQTGYNYMHMGGAAGVLIGGSTGAATANANVGVLAPWATITSAGITTSALTSSGLTSTGAIAVNSALGITSNQATQLIFNQTVSTITMGTGAATTINLGYATLPGGNVFVGSTLGTNVYNLILRANGQYNLVTSLNSNGGYGTTTYSNVSPTGGSGNGMIISITGVASGYLSAANITNPGSGYRSGDTITIPAGAGTPGGLGGSFVLQNYHPAKSSTQVGTGLWTFGIDGNLTLAGNVIFPTSSYIFGDFSNATVNSRTVFIPSAANASPGIYAAPSGTATGASWQAANSANLTAASKILIATNGSTDVQLVSGINGAGTYLPLSFYNNGAAQMQLTVAGNLNMTVNNSVSTSGTGNFIGNAVGTTATYTGNVSANYFVGNGALLTGISTGSNYGNTQVEVFANLSNYAWSANVTSANVGMKGYVDGANLAMKGYVDSVATLSSYSNVNVSALITTNGLTNYSNVNTKAYSESMGYQNFSNVNVTAYVTSLGVTNYSNINVIAYLAGNISTGNITATGFIGNGAGLTNVTFSQAGNIVGTQSNVTLQAGTFTSVFNNQGNVILPNVYVSGGATVVGTVNSNGGTAGTAFAVRGSGAVSNVALGYFPPVGTPAEMAIRDYSTANSTMYFDNTIGSGNVGGTFQFRSTSSYTQWAKIDRFGITLPTRPAFRVNGTGLVGQTTGNVNLKGAAVTTIFNQGSYFDATTGQFTAPVAGIYSVGLVCRVNTNSLSSIGVFKNGVIASSNTICYWEADASTGTATHFGVTGTVVLAAGDYLSANITNGTVTFDGNDNWHVTYIG